MDVRKVVIKLLENHVKVPGILCVPDCRSMTITWVLKSYPFSQAIHAQLGSFQLYTGHYPSDKLLTHCAQKISSFKHLPGSSSRQGWTSLVGRH